MKPNNVISNVQKINDKKSRSLDCRALSIGLEVKNYKFMCNLLGEAEKTGHSKKAQVKEWERCFSFERSGQKYIVTEIFDEPLLKVDGRSTGNNSVYVKYIELLLLHHLSEQPNHELTIIKNHLLERLGMVNKNYLDRKEMMKTFVDEFNLTRFELDDFYRRVYPKLNKSLFKTLNSMQKRSLIEYSEETIIVVMKDGFENYRVAKADDITQIDAVYNLVLESFGFKSMGQVACRFMSQGFYKRVNKILREKFGWDRIYKQLKISLVDANFSFQNSRDRIEQASLELNSKILDSINDQALKLYAKNQEKVSNEKDRIQGMLDEQHDGMRLFDISDDDIPIFKFPDNYVENQLMLADKLICTHRQKLD